MIYNKVKSHCFIRSIIMGILSIGHTHGSIVKHLWLVLILIIAIGLTSCAGAATSTATAEETVVIELELGEMYIKPASIDVPAGQTVTLHIKNVGSMPHNLKVNGVDGSKILKPNQEETITVGPFTTATPAWCALPGHRESGMEMIINIIGETDHSNPNVAPPLTASTMVASKSIPQ